MSLYHVLTSLIVASMLLGCGGESNDPGSDEKAVCSSNKDCGGGACVAFGEGTARCHPTCEVKGTSCAGSAHCNGVGLMDVNFCDDHKPSTNEDPPKPAEQPRIPCAKDADCSVIKPGAICATWKGHRDCTIPCVENPHCKMPSVAGMSIDFMSCQTDQGQTGRKACLPREECFTSPMSCITLPGLP